MKATIKHQSIIGLKELREKTDHFISQVEKGRSFTVVRRSKPIFKLVPVDEWGDEGTWETVVDFTKIRKNGVPVGDVLKALEHIREQDRKISSKTFSRSTRVCRSIV